MRACEQRIKADERASRRGVHIKNARIERLETELVRVWHRASAVERKRLEADLSRVEVELSQARYVARALATIVDNGDYLSCAHEALVVYNGLAKQGEANEATLDLVTELFGLGIEKPTAGRISWLKECGLIPPDLELVADGDDESPDSE